MEWIKREDKLPEEGIRVLVFSPEYREDDPMRVRVVDGKFVRICTDATHWAYIEEPEESS